MIRKSLLTLLFCLISLSPLWAETIYLKNGQTIIGKVLKYKADSITVHAIGDHQEREINKDDIYLINFDVNSEQRYTDFKKQMAANVVYLKNGEVIIGRITSYNPDFITIESLKGTGILQMPTAEVNMITTQDTVVDMNQRTGIGYVQHKSTLNDSTGNITYTTDQFSYKSFLDEASFIDTLVAFGSRKNAGVKLQVLSLDLRYGMVFDHFKNTLLYYGGQVGFLQVTDDVNQVSGSGIGFGGFIGAEMFFTQLPNFGFATELGIGYKRAGDYTALDFSASSFPSFSMHYYF
ncbi:MAG: hypothetical protein A2508_06870 [Candidatus Lambdaproteobacteria bacterium RIFOXYD12_FULL_49_8]|uniref:DUF481 domain-containing protein n=1 Tax=Candidatus Lambdaproteobacteria bacterium RIFOXYD2_FULL_50_16 TaxID=1817772 RepID=A0A1F6GF60_9PROT|nr:MAG: hypothetical protein A2527_04145 [Candidatus Lambdaproteobacteria bacterium RIFOXYD2_FULL_50_16]OGG97408.1 MAG: hypothetical protein A2508_06870 [Candidatus Lambdaproteobacteria bacterium RIFOXYD12_FULL_49_8]